MSSSLLFSQVIISQQSPLHLSVLPALLTIAKERQAPALIAAPPAVTWTTASSLRSPASSSHPSASVAEESELIANESQQPPGVSHDAPHSGHTVCSFTVNGSQLLHPFSQEDSKVTASLAALPSLSLPRVRLSLPGAHQAANAAAAVVTALLLRQMGDQPEGKALGEEKP